MKKSIPPTETPFGMKWCGRGKHFVSLEDFNKASKASDGLQSYCKECKKLARAETVQSKKQKGISYDGDKKCRTCGDTKPKKEFGVDWRNADSLMTVCKECDKKRLQTRKESLTRIENLDLVGTKICTNCKEPKSKTEFNKDKYRPDGLFPWCKTCSAANGRTHYENNTQSYRDYAKNYTPTPEQIKKRNLRVSKWKKANPERVATYAAQRRVRVSMNMTPEDTDHSTEYRKAIKYDPCYYCDELKDIMHVDHYISIYKNGTDHWWNLVNSCAPCNLSKGTMNGDDFITKLSEE